MKTKDLMKSSRGSWVFSFSDVIHFHFSFRRYQDFYLLEQKLTEFHGIFYDARLPVRRSGAAARNLEYLESVKEEFEHFLKVKFP